MALRIGRKSNPGVEGQVSRRGILKRGALWGALVAFGSAFNLVPAMGKAQAASSQNKLTITPVQGTQADEYIHTVLTSQGFKDFQKLAESKNALALQGNQPVVNHVSQGQTDFVYVSNSIRRGDEYSTYTAFFQPGSFTPTQVTGYLFVLVPGQSNMDVTGIRDGKEVSHIVMTPEGKILQGEMIDADGKQVVLDGLDLSKQNSTSGASPAACCNWCCMNNCFNSIGNIPNGVLWTAGLLCASACLVAPACVICILALGTITGTATALCDANCCF